MTNKITVRKVLQVIFAVGFIFLSARYVFTSEVPDGWYYSIALLAGFDLFIVTFYRDWIA